jgi:predicted enzyme related to lactoylglutathione lyase
MTTQIGNVTFDSADPAALAAFWSEVFGRPVDPVLSEFAASIGRDDAGQGFLFIKVPEGKTAKNRCHLDLRVSDRAAEVERLVGIGASVVAEKEEWGLRWTVLQDPDGNEFCVAEH